MPWLVAGTFRRLPKGSAQQPDGWWAGVVRNTGPDQAARDNALWQLIERLVPAETICDQLLRTASEDDLFCRPAMYVVGLLRDWDLTNTSEQSLGTYVSGRTGPTVALPGSDGLLARVRSAGVVADAFEVMLGSDTDADLVSATRELLAALTLWEVVQRGVLPKAASRELVWGVSRAHVWVVPLGSAHALDALTTLVREAENWAQFHSGLRELCFYDGFTPRKWFQGKRCPADPTKFQPRDVSLWLPSVSELEACCISPPVGEQLKSRRREIVLNTVAAGADAVMNELAHDLRDRGYTVARDDALIDRIATPPCRAFRCRWGYWARRGLEAGPAPFPEEETQIRPSEDTSTESSVGPWWWPIGSWARRGAL